MAEVNLLDKLPKGKRNLNARATAKTEDHIRISREYGEQYFDGPREYGYGGYRDDGRWHSVARDIIAQYGLKSGMRVLDVGCGKGFLVKALLAECPGLEAFGLDVSLYALMHCSPEAKRPGRRLFFFLFGSGLRERGRFSFRLPLRLIPKAIRSRLSP